ncbi:cytochrome o ubiquinol oxidase subunit I [Methylomonas methanica]|uniref:Cytochrome bo(3) ubiquinol oxidase subunit 1 n=1 Tax=Methylomonas methanica (strain DSM 25384 / MC09) TaxID=857087 RepID=F9ZX94_METMM|nr:cytochrome o ubiquinol oxidase subunit I [Methylomonas methanica]AEF99704.1 cytochrome o ubiquinol oxidase, subunit I [Methylomonas methanica MC09]
MFGKLSLADITYDNPIVLGGVLIMLAGALTSALLITYFRKWPYLWQHWLTSMDHKKIGIMYIVLALVMLLRGFADAIMMRAQQWLAEGANQGFLTPNHYDQIFTAHGTIMIIFMAMPFLTGLMNIVIPLQLGKRDVAFPFLNALSLWLTVAGAMLIMVSLAVGEFSTAGWTGYPPYSELQYSPGEGVDYWIWALMLSGAASTMTGINFLVTVLFERAPGMTLMRMPLFCWTALCTSILMTLAFPALTVATVLLGLDRYLGMHFFTNGNGGNMMNFVNLFWIWGHPEVYILILPAFGIFSEVISTFSGKRLFGYRSLVYATLVIALLSFTVWLHHFFTMGASAGVNAAFGIATMVIAVPTGVKIFDWLLTMYRGRIRFNVPMLWALAFLPSFAIGGATGVLLAVPPVDFMMHNSEFLVAHFHNMLIPGALFGYLAGYSYWFPKAFGFRLDEKWGKLAFWNWLMGFYLAFMPLYVLGLMGMPRRMEHYDNPEWQPLLMVAAAGAFFIFLGIGCLAIQLWVSIKNREANLDTLGDPWNGRSLEWAIASPPPVYNFAVIPEVNSIDAFWRIKPENIATKQAIQYQDIDLPRNSSVGIVFGACAFVFGFAMVWHIGWLAVAAGLAMLSAIILRSFDDATEYRLTAAEVEQIERGRFSRLEQGGDALYAGKADGWGE